MPCCRLGPFPGSAIGKGGRSQKSEKRGRPLLADAGLSEFQAWKWEGGRPLTFLPWFEKRGFVAFTFEPGKEPLSGLGLSS